MIILLSDHRGEKLKQQFINYFRKNNYDYLVIDNHETNVDYPTVAKNGVEKVLENSQNFGVFICASGYGMDMAANRFNGIRAGICKNKMDAIKIRSHENANVLVLSAITSNKIIDGKLVVGKKELSYKKAFKIFEFFINQTFDGGRHEKRIKQLDLINNN